MSERKLRFCDLIRIFSKCIETIHPTTRVLLIILGWGYVRSWALPEKLPIVQPFSKFPAILRNPKVHHRVHKSPSLVPILCQFNLVPTIPSYLSKIHFNIAHLPTSWSSEWSLSFWLSIRATCPAHVILLIILCMIISINSFLLIVAHSIKICLLMPKVLKWAPNGRHRRRNRKRLLSRPLMLLWTGNIVESCLCLRHPYRHYLRDC
jgi:hypothetical protein